MSFFTVCPLALIDSCFLTGLQEVLCAHDPSPLRKFCLLRQERRQCTCVCLEWDLKPTVTDKVIRMFTVRRVMTSDSKHNLYNPSCGTFPIHAIPVFLLYTACVYFCCIDGKNSGEIITAISNHWGRVRWSKLQLQSKMGCIEEVFIYFLSLFLSLCLSSALPLSDRKP